MSMSDNHLEQIASSLEEITRQNSEIIDYLRSISDDLNWTTPGSSLGMLDGRLEAVEQALTSMENSICLEIGTAIAPSV